MLVSSTNEVDSLHFLMEDSFSFRHWSNRLLETSDSISSITQKVLKVFQHFKSTIMFEDESLKCVDGIEVLTKDQIKPLLPTEALI